MLKLLEPPTLEVTPAAAKPRIRPTETTIEIWHCGRSATITRARLATQAEIDAGPRTGFGDSVYYWPARISLMGHAPLCVPRMAHAAPPNPRRNFPGNVDEHMRISDSMRSRLAIACLAAIDPFLDELGKLGPDDPRLRERVFTEIVGPDLTHGAILVPGKGAVVAATRHEAGRQGVAGLEIRSYRIGDRAAHGGYNLTYTGVIRSVGAKRVIISDNRDGSGKRSHSLTAERFASWNSRSIERIDQTNSEWCD